LAAHDHRRGRGGDGGRRRRGGGRRGRRRRGRRLRAVDGDLAGGGGGLPGRVLDHRGQRAGRAARVGRQRVAGRVRRPVRDTDDERTVVEDDAVHADVVLG